MRLDRRPAATRPPAPVLGRSGGSASPASRAPADVVDAAVLESATGPDAGSPPALSAAGVLTLQRVAGNAAVSGYLAGRRPTVQRWGLPWVGIAPAHPELREGMTGEAVRELQEKLSLATAAGGPLTIDGEFGPATRRRVRAFRAARGGLGNSPVADAALWTALDAAVAALPAPVRPTISVGSTGPDVALAQQKLNAIVGAGAPLAIDGIFSLPMAALVLAFKAGRGLTANGTIDAATWRELDRAAAGGGTRQEGGTAVEQHVLNSAGASPLGAPIAGTTLHRPVGPGGLLRGPAVREFQLKLNAWRTTQALAPITDDGKWGNDTRTATLAFQAATPGLAPGNGIGDQATWTALDAIAGTVAVGFRERQWREEVGGHTYGMTNAGNGGSRYAWEIRARDIRVTSKVRFTGAPPPSAWFAHVRNAWNRYKAVREGTNDSLLINFEMVRGSGADSRTVNVVPPPTVLRANAGTWYVADPNAAGFGAARVRPPHRAPRRVPAAPGRLPRDHGPRA